VVNVDCAEKRPSVTLENGEKIEADVIIGADGMWNDQDIKSSSHGSNSLTIAGVASSVRGQVLGYQRDPKPTGDMGYRVTISREKLERLNNPAVEPVL
jgi:hypothetical protein